MLFQMANIKKNLGYQTLYQILNVGLPLITAPFLARVLGAEPLGIMSYTSSIVHYFTLFAMMGLTYYGTRSIAVVKEDPQNRNKTFSEIYCMQLITTGIAFVAYGIYMVLICRDNVLISLIQGLAVLACFFDISWFFFGIEQFKITVIRGMVIRIVSVALMLILVRSPADLWIYAILLIGSTLASQIVLWFYVPRFLKFTKPSYQGVKRHFGPNVKLFIPLLAMSVYHIMDKTMLGMLSNYTESGFYYNADKVINIPMGLLSGVVTVLLPRMSALAGANRKEDLDALFNTSIRSISLVSAAICCGIAAIAKEFTPLFFGQGYDDCVILIISLAPVLFIKGYSFISRYLYLIPNKMENQFTASVVAGAIVNLIINFLLIPSQGALGAVIGTLAAELVACLWQYRLLISKLDCLRSVFVGMVYFTIGILMLFGVRYATRYIETTIILKVAIEITIGVVIYGALCLAYWKLSKNDEELRLIKSFIVR